MNHDHASKAFLVVVALTTLGFTQWGLAPSRVRTPAAEPIRSIPLGSGGWSVVDRVGLSSEGRPQAMASRSSMTYAAGLVEQDGKAAWTVRMTSDAGANWKTLESGLTGYRVSAVTGIAIGEDGVLVVAGWANSTPRERAKWIVRGSNDGGSSWRTLDRLSEASASATAISDDGVIYVVGGAGDRWVVRRSSDNGRSWATVDQLGAPGSAAVARAVAAGRGSEVFVGGVLGGKWVVRHSYDGRSWSTVDEMPENPGSVLAAARWRDQVVFAGNMGGRWFVRESSFDHPTGWETIDESIPVSETGSSSADAVAISEDGTVFVTGHLFGVPETQPGARRGLYSLTRRSHLFAGGAFEFHETGAEPACALAAPASAVGSAVDSRGNAFLAASCGGWIVRKLRAACE